MANKIHAVIWDRVGLEKVRGFVREWASDWVAKVNSANAVSQPKFAFASLWDPELPALPLPPSHRERSPAEKWAALSAVHDEFDLTGDKVLPWPLPDDKDLAALTKWMRGEGGAYMKLSREASELRETYADAVGRWLEDVGTGKEPSPNDDLRGEADGPIEPDGFIWRGNAYYGLRRGTFGALRYVWNCRGRAATLGMEMASAVGDHADTDFSDSFLRGLRQELNDFFRDNKLPFHAQNKNEYLCIKDGDPKPKKASRPVAMPKSRRIK